MHDRRFIPMGLVACLGLLTSPLWAQQRVPHNQDKPPGPALSPEEAVKKMTVPPGFSVEIVAAEPQIVNPVAMTFDERGRVWVTESLEYPRASAGPGKDRVKILEDTDGDGRMDKVTLFAEGLNIPSGIAVGYGGVWVANSPDLLFLQDTDGDGKADKQEVVVTGFGRTDTHELPNSLMWGPDGWLYGLNGVFNFSHVFYSKNNANYKENHPGWKFTCAMFRIHPRTREFQIFAEGTSNPWGIAFDNEGSAFVSACVIDHLWHIVETGYYHRQGGPYPPFTWKIESIVKHKHQKAAYCGLHFFDSDAYPEQYREKLYMGNIHGNCINVDKLQRDGSTYFATGEPDFLSANDSWFMPVAQKTGPDGCLYVLDWYDQYHCYQDARRDPNGIERAKGRLYRVRYVGETKVASGERRSVSATSSAATKDAPKSARLYPQFDLTKESDDQLMARLGHPNIWVRDIAQRLLTERANPETRAKLTRLIDLDSTPRKARTHALWIVLSARELDAEVHLKLLSDKDPSTRAFAVRAAGNKRNVSDPISQRVAALATDPSPDVRLQVAIASTKIEGLPPTAPLGHVLAESPNDKLIPHIVWQNLEPLLRDHSDEFVALMTQLREKDPSLSRAAVVGLDRMASYLTDRLLATENVSPRVLADLIALFRRSFFPDGLLACLDRIAESSKNGELKGERLRKVRETLTPVLRSLDEGSLAGQLQSRFLLAIWGDPAATKTTFDMAGDYSLAWGWRRSAFETLVAAKHPDLVSLTEKLLSSSNTPPELQSAMLAALGKTDDPRLAPVITTAYPALDAAVQPRAIELLTQRAAWAKVLLAAVGEKKIPAEALNLNHLRKLNATKDPGIIKAVQAQWGTIREGRNPQRELIIADMRRFIRANPGDAHRGEEVFKKVCGQCHKIYGEGQEVGPDITLNGRNSYDQLLSNVFDPSLVIGASYQARTILTTQGRVVSGLVAEESEQRVVLKVQGGKQEVIPRGDIDEMKTSELSLMPEDVEKTLKPQEIADLFAYITLDKPPSDPTAKRLPGVYDGPAPARKK